MPGAQWTLSEGWRCAVCTSDLKLHYPHCGPFVIRFPVHEFGVEAFCPMGSHFLLVVREERAERGFLPYCFYAVTSRAS